MSLLRGLVERRDWDPATGLDPSAIPSNGSLLPMAVSGRLVNERSAVQSLAVFRCVNLITDAISTLPLNAMAPRDGVLEPVGNPPPIVANPFAEVDRREGFAQILTSCLLRGNGVCQVVDRDRYARPTSLLNIHPDHVNVDRDRRTKRRIYEIDGKTVPTADVVHVKGFTLPGALVGLDPITTAQVGLGLALSAEEYAARFFGQGGVPSGVITVPKDTPADDKTVRRIALEWRKKHAGLKRAHSPAILTGGATYQAITLTFEQLQFLQTRAFSNTEIAMMYGVPPHLVGQVDRTTSWGTGIEVQGTQFATYTLRGWLSRLEHAWSAMLPGPQLAEFELDALLRADSATRWDNWAVARSIGGMTSNEIRVKERLRPKPGGDNLDQPMNWGPVARRPSAQPPTDTPSDGGADA